MSVATRIFGKNAYQETSPPLVHPNMCSRTDFTMSIISRVRIRPLVRQTAEWCKPSKNVGKDLQPVPHKECVRESVQDRRIVIDGGRGEGREIEVVVRLGQGQSARVDD